MAVEIGYWPIRGLGNPVRFLLEYLGIEYKETRYDDPQKWFGKDKMETGLDFPNIPWYKDDDVHLSQSGAILRYLGEKHGLDGKDAVERARLNVLALEGADFTATMAKVVYGTDFAGMKDDLHKKLSTKMEQLEKYLGDNKFLSGDEPKYPDFHWFETLQVAFAMFPDLKEKFPKVMAFVDRFAALPKIKAYIESEKFIKYPFFYFTTTANWPGNFPTEK